MYFSVKLAFVCGHEFSLFSDSGLTSSSSAPNLADLSRSTHDKVDFQGFLADSLNRY